ncbi:hypothetical protein Hanom_Chr10g00918881 [Helianthus anomalus]
MPQPPIGPKDTLGDIYYKTYTEEPCSDAPHQAPWSLKQKDTFLEFALFNRKRARSHDGLYHAYIVGEANTRAAKNQIVREWRIMVKDFEKLRSAFNEEKAKFESERKSEEWGPEGLRGKLLAVEELLSKERADWKEECKKDNQHMYAARSKITDLEAQIATLTKQVEDVEVDKKRVEVQQL